MKKIVVKEISLNFHFRNEMEVSDRLAELMKKTEKGPLTEQETVEFEELWEALDEEVINLIDFNNWGHYNYTVDVNDDEMWLEESKC